MTWAERVVDIQAGDRVQYSRDFLRSTGQYTGAAPFAKGTVRELKQIGDTTLAVIDWDKNRDEIPAKVNVANLKKIGQIGLG